MTVDEMLADQPDPERGIHSVVDHIIAELEDVEVIRPHLNVHTIATLFDARRMQGVERYGAELRTHNGRDPLIDALQEMTDACLYLTQEHMERDPDGFPPRRLSLAFACLHEIYRELLKR